MLMQGLVSSESACLWISSRALSGCPFMTRASAMHSDGASTSTAHECLRLEHEVTDTIDVTFRRVRHQMFQQDGTRHSVFDCVCGFHVVENLPCAIHILRKARACRCSLNVTLLARIPLGQLLGVIEVICIEVRLEESVVIPGVHSNDRQPQIIIRVSTEG